MRTPLVTKEQLAQITTPMQVIEYVRLRIVQQGEPSVSLRVGTCMYRLQREVDGPMLACGIGMCIPDEEYSDGMEREAVTTLLEGLNPGNKPVPQSETLGSLEAIAGRHLLTALQRAHDRAADHARYDFPYDIEARNTAFVKRFLSGVDRIIELVKIDPNHPRLKEISA